MTTIIGSRSPVLTYGPCGLSSPAEGWQVANEFFSIDQNGTDVGMVTFASNSSIRTNFTGNAVSFRVSYASNTTAWTTLLSINDSVVSNTTSVTGLPIGMHAVRLDLMRGEGATPNKDEWVRFDGFEGSLGGMITAQTHNMTIDDSAWRNWTVILTPGWNMLEQDQSNYISESQYEAEKATASRNFNSSLSWTEQANAGNSIVFNGSAVWVYGLAGGEAGAYEVILDNVTRGIYNATGGPRVYNTVLWHASSLADSYHNLSLRNVEEGKRLSFDRLVATSRLSDPPPHRVPLPPPTSALTPAPTTSTATEASQSAASTAISTGGYVGIAIGIGILVIGLLVWAFTVWSCVGGKVRRRRDVTPLGPGTHKDKSHPFHELKTVPGYVKSRDVAALEAEKKEADLEAANKGSSPSYPPRVATPMSFFTRSPKPKSAAQTAQGLKISKPLPVSSSVEPLWTGSISEDPFLSAPASASALSLPQTWGASYGPPSPPSSPPRIPLPEVPTSPQSANATRATAAGSSLHSSQSNSSSRSSSTTIDNSHRRSDPRTEQGDIGDGDGDGRADTTRYAVGGIIDSYNRESTATDTTGMAFGSPAEDNVPTLPAPAPASPQHVVTPSPKRRFFGFGAGNQEHGAASGSQSPRKSVGSGWLYM